MFVVSREIGRANTVNRAGLREPTALHCLTFTLFLVGFAMLAHAGIRGPGKYCGVVVFDRWDTCFLLSGSYITYISENAKTELRPYAGKAMQLDASSVFQPENPGDALIREYTMVGPAPDTQRWATLDGLKLIARSDFGPDGKPTFMIEVHNSSGHPIKVDSHEVGPALLGRVSKSPFLASDGNSMVVITRGDLVTPSSWGSTVDGVPHSYTYTIDPKPARLNDSS